MYSAILMAALTTAPATQGFCFRARACHGCNGCYAARSACHGCNGCYAARSACHGCYGGGQWYGYSGYGHGRGGYGCYAGCFGCFCYGGGYDVGFGGYYGSSYPGSFHGGCHGAGHGARHGYAPAGCHGCHGCHGAAGCNGGFAHPEPAPPSRPYESERAPERVPPPREDKKEQARARVRIDVPADAKVYIDGQLMQSAATPRVFQTPDLREGQLYFYDLRAEVVREGQVVSETQRVILRPGGESVASFANLGQATATASARAAD